MILKELYRIGQQMKVSEDWEWPVSGYDERKICWDVYLTDDGQFDYLMLIDASDKSLGRIMAPCIDRSNGVVPCLIVDKPEYVLGLGKNGEKFFQAYISLLERCADETGVVGVRTISSYLKKHKDQLIEVMSEKGFSYQENGAKSVQANSWINFTVGGLCPADEPVVQRWWADQVKDELVDKTEYCCISGDYGPITRKFPVSIRVNGTSCKLASIDAPACKSYGYDKTDHAPMSHNAALIAGTALKLLLAEDITSHKLGNINCVFWTKPREMLEALGIVDIDPFFNYGDDMQASQVKLLWESVSKGKISHIQHERFYMLMLTNTKSRIVVKSTLECSLGELVNNINEWFMAIGLAKPNTRPIGLGSLLDSIKTGNRRYNDSLQLSLMKKAYFDIPLGADFYSAALNKADSAFRNSKNPPEWRCPWPEHISIIKLYLSQKHPEVMRLSELQEDYPDVAYHFGRLLAVYEAIQLDASKVQSTVSERFFTPMTTRPLRVLPKLEILVKAHLGKGKRERGIGWEVSANKRLENVYMAIKKLSPEGDLVFNQDQQGLFVIGYWNEKFRTYNSEKKEGDSNNEA